MMRWSCCCCWGFRLTIRKSHSGNARSTRLSEDFGIEGTYAGLLWEAGGRALRVLISTGKRSLVIPPRELASGRRRGETPLCAGGYGARDLHLLVRRSPAPVVCRFGSYAPGSGYVTGRLIGKPAEKRHGIRRGTPSPIVRWTRGIRLVEGPDALAGWRYGMRGHSRPAVGHPPPRVARGGRWVLELCPKRSAG